MAEQEVGGEQAFYIDVGTRVRELEGKYNLLRDRMLLINNNMIEEYKKTITEIKLLNGDVQEIKVDLFRIREALKHLLKELELFARKEDMKFLEKYINLWNPMKFVTEEDVKNLIERHKEKEVIQNVRKSK